MPIYGAMQGGVTIAPLSSVFPLSPVMDSDGGGAPPGGLEEFLLLENGDFILLETGISLLLQEASP
jgi:hypothetical protein